jgi:hypothetical protein
VQFRHGRATVSGERGRSLSRGEGRTGIATIRKVRIRSASLCNFVTSRKGNEMIAAFPFLVLLTIGTMCSVVGCLVPLSGIAAAAAVNLSRRSGAAVVCAVWAINQVAGFTLHAYPKDTGTYAWALALGLASIAAYAAARALRANPLAAFGAAFVTFEIVLVCFSIRLGDWNAYAPHWLFEVLALNAAWFAGAHVVLRTFLRHPILGPVRE